MFDHTFDEVVESVQKLIQQVPVWVANIETIVNDLGEVQRPLQPAAAVGLSGSTALSSQSLSSRPSHTALQSPRPVYYDGATQHRFADLVRSLGHCRNAMRRGKRCAQVNLWDRRRSVSSSSRSSSSSTLCADDASATLANKVVSPGDDPRRIDLQGPVGAFARTADTDAFDHIDTMLAQAQAWCETAAHQHLRGLDCAADLSRARERLADAACAADTHLPRLRRLAEQIAARRRRSSERARCRRQADAEVARSVHGLTQMLSLCLDDLRPSLAPQWPTIQALEQIEIEVGDDAASDAGDAYLPPILFDKFRMRGSTAPVVQC